MDEMLYQRCPACNGTRTLSEPATLNTGGTTTECPCRRSEHPGWAAVGVTLGQVERLARKVEVNADLLARKVEANAALLAACERARRFLDLEEPTLAQADSLGTQLDLAIAKAMGTGIPPAGAAS